MMYTLRCYSCCGSVLVRAGGERQLLLLCGALLQARCTIEFKQSVTYTETMPVCRSLLIALCSDQRVNEFVYDVVVLVMYT